MNLSDLNFSAASIVGNILFSAIGFVAFAYGKRTGRFRMMAVGGVLMAYSYFVSGTLWMYAVGAALTASLFFLRDQ